MAPSFPRSLIGWPSTTESAGAAAAAVPERAGGEKCREVAGSRAVILLDPIWQARDGESHHAMAVVKLVDQTGPPRG